MGLRFSKRLRVFPGFTINLSKSGISTSVGIKGLSLNLGKKGMYVNAGLPGTGIYARFKVSGNGTNAKGPDTQFDEEIERSVMLDEIASSEVGTMSDAIGTQIIEDIKEAKVQNAMLRKEIVIWTAKWFTLFVLELFSYVLIFGFFNKKIAGLRKDAQGITKELKGFLQETSVKLDINFDPTGNELYGAVMSEYEKLCKVSKIWDVTGSAKNDGIRDRSGAGWIVERRAVRFGMGALDFVKCAHEPFHIRNANGSDIFVYPFHVVVGGKSKFDIISLASVDIRLSESRFIETEAVPKDGEIVSYTWKKVNKNGTPDKRFKGNYQIPVMKYATIALTSDTGLNEEYMLSDFNAASRFVSSFERYVEYSR